MVREEHVVHLADVILRRTALAFTGRSDRAVLEEVAEALAPALGWDDERRDAEIAATAELLRDAHGVEVAVDA